MRRQFSQGATIVLLDRIRRIQFLDLTIRIHSNKNVCHIGLSEEEEGIHEQYTVFSLSIWATHVDLVFVIARLQVIQKCGLIE